MSTASVTQKRFNCPHCGAFADHMWLYLLGKRIWVNSKNASPADTLDEGEYLSYEKDIFESHTHATADVYLSNGFSSRCESCDKFTIWVGDRQIHPPVSNAPKMNTDTPEHIAQDYREAASIMSVSPRGAAALLRLAIQKLCAHVGEKGRNINDDIAELVKKGLDTRIQQALDALRVIGNEAVHPGTMDIKDDPSTVASLFKLFNIIVDRMISEPKHIDSVYELLPADKRAGIDARDKITRRP